MLPLIILALVVFVGFIVYGSTLTGELPESYSALGTFMDEYFPGAAINPWSIVTFAVAFLMVPPMVEAGEGSILQCLGFFAPLYLIVVSLTPRWDIDKRQHRIHTAGAIVCAVLAFAWLLLIRGHWWVVALCLALGCAAGWRTKTLPGSLVFWGEMVMFASVYLSLIIGG